MLSKNYNNKLDDIIRLINSNNNSDKSENDRLKLD